MGALSVYGETYAGDPNSNVTPNRLYQVCFDTTNKIMYVAESLSSSGWQPYGFGAYTQTWSPTASFSTTDADSWVYGTRVGRYFVLGNLCTFTLQLECTPTMGSASGNLQISLPSTAANNTGADFSVPVRVRGTGLTWDTGREDIVGYIIANTNQVIFYTQGDTTQALTRNQADVATGVALTFTISGSYEVA